MQFAILALNNLDGPWSNLLSDGPGNTWLRDVKTKTDYWSYYSKRKNSIDFIINRLFSSRIANSIWKNRNIKLDEMEVTLENSALVIDIHENWLNLVNKTLKAIEYALKNSDFEYLIRINSTAYCDLNKISEHLQKLNRPNYAGPLLNKKSFISGWAIILSRDACQLLVEARKQTCLFDDEFIGKFLKTKDILPSSIPFLEINSFEDLNNLKESDYSTFPLIRFKSTGDHNKRFDDLIMQKFHQKRVTAL